jgi:hypothetical protein
VKQLSSAERTQLPPQTESPPFQSRAETPVVDEEYGYHNQPSNHCSMKNQYSPLPAATQLWHNVTNPRYLSDCGCQSSTGCHPHDFQPINQVQNPPKNVQHNNNHQTKESNFNLQHKKNRYQSNLSSIGPHAEDRFYQRGPMNIQTDPYSQSNSQHYSMSANGHPEDCDTCQPFHGGNFGSNSSNHSHYGT